MRLLAPFVVSAVCVSSLALAGTRGNGVWREESRKISDFHEIAVGGGAKLTIKKGAPSLTISGDENILPLMRTEVQNGRLVIEQTEWNLRPTRQVLVVVTVQSLDVLDASGGVDVIFEGGASESKLKVSLSGGVEFIARGLAVNSLRLDASGGVNARLSGTAKSFVLDLSGGVEVEAKSLEAANVVVDASGGCTVKVRATESIKADGSGGVAIGVAGNPPKRTVHTSGGADVSSLD
jgi:Putative auto-transporter adhesin, head GIN domain